MVSIWARLRSSSLLLLFSSWSICPQGTNCSCLAWGPSISCLRVVSKVEESGGPVTTALATSSRQGSAAGCTWQGAGPEGQNCPSSPNGLVFPSKLRFATVQWRPQFPVVQGSLQREPPGQPCVPTRHLLRVVPFWAQGSLAHGRHQQTHITRLVVSRKVNN